jgi:hypothetical protein
MEEVRIISPGGAITAGTQIGGRFFISGAPVPLTTNGNGQLGPPFARSVDCKKSFRFQKPPRFSQRAAITRFNSSHQFSVRLGYNPSDLTGIQDESQNQTLGQNDFSRTGIQKLRDTTFVASLSSVLSNTMVNEAAFQFGRRKATFDSQVPGVALQITGTAFMGSNPFSPVDRTENRYQFRDNLNWISGNHSFKFGGDINFIDVNARFELNFPALFNFSELPAVRWLRASSPDSQLRLRILRRSSRMVLASQVLSSKVLAILSGIKNKPIAFFAQGLLESSTQSDT